VDAFARNVSLWPRVRVIGVVLVAGVASVVPFALSAGAADSVNLSTSLLNSVAFPVTNSPVRVSVSVDNSGTATATNVVADVSIPTGATVLDHSANCSTAATTVSCTFASIAAGTGDGSNVFFSFPTTGTRTVTSTAHATQPDVDANSTDHVDVVVGNENADLVGASETHRVVVGTQTTFRVGHSFENNGPTAAGQATVAGTVTGATIVPGSFNFFGDFFNEQANHAADDCRVTSTTFTCTPVFSAGNFDAPQPFVFYDVTLPTTPGTIVASATLTGRADPNHANDTSKITVDVDPPAAEIFTQLVAPGAPVASSTPFLLQGFVLNSGELAAQSLVAVLTAPASWTIALPAGPLPTGVSCAIVASPHSMSCTRTALAAGDNWSPGAELTPPAGTGTGTVSLDVTTTTPEIGVFPNAASVDIAFRPGGETPAITSTPSTGLVDGQTVTLAGTGFSAGGGIFFCQGILTGHTPSPADCGDTITSTQADATGSFSISVTVHRFLVVVGTGVIDCAQPQSTCAFGADDLSLSTGIVSTPLAFTPQAPVTDPFNARIEGVVVDSGGHPIANAPVRGYTATDEFVGTLFATTDASGHYDLEDAEPGITYRIRFGAPSGSGFVPEWYAGPGAMQPSRARAIDVRLSAAQPTLEANATLSEGGAIAGTVLGPGGAPVANATVWAYRNENGLVGSLAAATGADGTYRIQSVRPDTDLRLLIVPPPSSGLAVEWFHDATSREAAQVVRVAAGATATVDVQLAP
jgi:hypothetical protein